MAGRCQTVRRLVSLQHTARWGKASARRHTIRSLLLGKKQAAELYYATSFHSEFNFCFYLFFSSLEYKVVKNNDFICRLTSTERFHFPSYQPPTTVVPCSYLLSRYRHEQNMNKTRIGQVENADKLQLQFGFLAHHFLVSLGVLHGF